MAHFGDFCQIVRNAVKLKIAARQQKLLLWHSPICCRAERERCCRVIVAGVYIVWWRALDLVLISYCHPSIGLGLFIATRRHYWRQNCLASAFAVFVAKKEELYTKTARISRQLVLVYRTRITVNGWYWNTCKLVFTKTCIQVPGLADSVNPALNAV